MALPAYGPNQYLPTILGYGPQPTTTPFYPPAPAATGPTVANAAALPASSISPTMSTSSPTSWMPGPVPVPAGASVTDAQTGQIINGAAAEAAGTGTGDNLYDGLWETGKIGWNPGTIDLALSGIKTVGGLWSAWQENKIAKDQIKLSRDTTNVNLANQISAYNTALEDKTRHRSSYMGESSAESDAYLKDHKLANRQI